MRTIHGALLLAIVLLSLSSGKARSAKAVPFFPDLL
jgi:hypothetical protein